jgi:peptidoglycan-associated lipoprotein
MGRMVKKMLKKIFYLLTVLSVTLSLVSCGASRQSRTAVDTDMEALTKAETVTEEERMWEKIWERVLSNGEEIKSPSHDKSAVNDILFDYDSYQIRQDERPALNAAASFLNKKKQVKIVIEGHGDERGTNEYNLALGDKRAKATSNYLRSRGISPSRVHTVTYGEEKPLCTKSAESCWRMNRRSSIKLSDLD